MVPLYVWWKQAAIVVDQAANVAFCGWADETISARAYRTRATKWGGVAYRWINRLFFWQEDHCMASYAQEMFRNHLPMEYRASLR